MGVLKGLEPERVFYYFEEICKIPHGSGNTKAISDYCIEVARQCGLQCRQDESNNVVVWKPGTSGYETSDSVMLQGHLDMVCEKEEGYEIDFERDGLKLQLEDDIISAEGTTLGGDDGIAVAYALALLEADDIPHPPLEIVLTTDEEVGMTGASALDYSDLKSTKMLNLDSEEEGYLLVSCAGGVRANVDITVQREMKNGCQVTLIVTGLQGGHSGVEIDKGRGNACKVLGRILYALKQDLSFDIKSVNGGNKDNAIPREAKAVLLLPNQEVDPFVEKLKELATQIKHEFAQTDAGIDIKTEYNKREGAECFVMTKDSSDKVIAALVSSPDGVQKMSFDIPGLVQTSLNLGILQTTESKVEYIFALRSSVDSEKNALVEQLTCLTQLLGGTIHCFGEYPAWEYRKKSPLRDLMIEVYQEQYGKKPVVEALHAGVECGIFSGNLPGLDCVSFGPDMKDIHTPNESMDVKSVARTWEYLLEILKRLK